MREPSDWSNLRDDEDEDPTDNGNYKRNKFSSSRHGDNNQGKDNKTAAGNQEDDWYAVQEKKLADQYGGNFIRVKYASSGRVVYLCELCVAECNAKKSLELHCAGMKHLKKKDLWEKSGRPDASVGLSMNDPESEMNFDARPSQKSENDWRENSKYDQSWNNSKGRSGRSPPPYDRRFDQGRRSPDVFHSGRLGPRDRPSAPSPPRFRAPEPVQDGPAAGLLNKLNECCLKSAEDSQFAMEIVASLCKSLKEYSEDIGENKIAELLSEAELKIGTIKALKVGMKMLSSAPVPSGIGGGMGRGPSRQGLPPGHGPYGGGGDPVWDRPGGMIGTGGMGPPGMMRGGFGPSSGGMGSSPFSSGRGFSPYMGRGGSRGWAGAPMF